MNATSIDILPANTDYEHFYFNYLAKNKACIFESNITSNWRCRQKWIDRNNHIDIQYMKKRFGKCIVNVTECDNNDLYDKPNTTEMTFDEYLDYFVESSSKNNRLTCDVRKCLYLKNWHFVQQFPGYEAYKVPIYFESDYLNEYWHQKDDDYKFVYLGPKGSWTPLHTDVYSSYSWSANIAGRKKWLFIKPEDAVKVKKRYKQVPNDVRSLSSELDIEIIEVIQNSGEIIFVPSNWMHQVFNLEDTLSINHNWFNACNLYLIWNELRVAFRDTQLELRDICDLCDTFTYNQECEKLLKANYGMDYSQFIDILNVVVKRIVNNSTDDYNCEFRLHHEVQVITSLLQDNEFLKELQLIPELESKVNDLKCALALVKKEEMSNC